MPSTTSRTSIRSAAWRISLWGTLAFAFGTMFVFIFLHSFVASDIERRSDSWLSGEVEVLGDVANRTPKDALYGTVVEEVAELAGKEVPLLYRESRSDDTVFFLQTGSDGGLKLWVGAGSGLSFVQAIRGLSIVPDQPTDLQVKGFGVPYRVASFVMNDGSTIYLGLSERDELRVLRQLRVRFISIWALLVLLGFSIEFFTTRRMLRPVREINEAASRIGHSDLTARVPTTPQNDEVGQLAGTLNRMLDRIESSVHQLHTITDSLAHDLRSPLTAIRGKLEMSLTGATEDERTEAIIGSIDELDRLTDFLNKSLDVAEARADALRLSPVAVDLDELLRVMVDLYEPSMSEKGISMWLRSTGPLYVEADAALLHRMAANLFDNELKHLRAGCTVRISLSDQAQAAMMVFEDDGPGFDAEVTPHLFEDRVRGKNSKGHGLGLAFIGAVARAHGGTVSAINRIGGGARIEVTLPAPEKKGVEAAEQTAIGSH